MSIELLHHHAALALAYVASVAAAGLGVAACDRPAKETSTSAAAEIESEPKRKVPLLVPGDETIPAGHAGELVRQGRLYATRTSEELPQLVGSDLHCTSCHLEAGTRGNAGPWVGLSSAYPMYRARAGREITLEERIDECFERSVNGKAPGKGSPVTRAFVAYIEWLSRDVPRGSEVLGRGFPRVERPPIVDPDNGRNVYAARCASCHGANGEGRRQADGSYQFPPLWGDRTFNIGAGMARLDTAAAFVRHDMPLGRPEPLTATDAYDVAAYFTEQPRPDYLPKSGDWPRGGKPPDARY